MYPYEPTKKDIWIENRIEELCDIDQLINYTWFEDCIDWGKVGQYLLPIAEKDYEEYLAEKEIAAWEDRQRWDDRYVKNYYYIFLYLFMYTKVL